MTNAYLDAIAKLTVILRESEVVEEEEDEGSYVSGSDHLTDPESYTFSCYSDPDTDVEECAEEDIPKESSKNSRFFVGKDKLTVWKCKSAEVDNEKVESIEDLTLPGPKGEALNVTDPISSWKLLFSDSLIEKIVQSTNALINKRITNFARERDCRPTDAKEIYALIGLLYLGGLYKSSHTNVKDLWSSDGTGMGIFHSTMSYKRFLLLLRHLCFADPESCAKQEDVDNLASIRELFQLFTDNCQKSYDVGKYLTTDYMLIPFRGKCIFRQYIPKNAVKYGIKVFPLVDSCTLYTYNIEIYDSKQKEGPCKVSNSPDEIAKRLTSPLFKSGNRNLTVDSWFTSYPLAKYLLSQNITLVGAIKQNKPEVPSQFRTGVKRAPYSSIFGFRDDATLVSYQSEPKKSTLFLSTMHKDDAIHTSDSKGTPEILRFYNYTKDAVKSLEAMVASYSTARITSRWPVVIFFYLLNIAALNARIILMSTQDPPLKYRSRRAFLKDLSLSLVRDHIKFRSGLETLPRNLRMECAEVSGACGDADEPPEKKSKTMTPKKGRCSLCPRSKDKKTKTVCFYCMRLVCHTHLVPVCTLCAKGETYP